MVSRALALLYVESCERVSPAYRLREALTLSEKQEASRRELAYREELSSQAAAAAEQRAEQQAAFRQMQVELRNVQRQQDAHDVQRANLEMAAEQRVASQLRQAQAEIQALQARLIQKGEELSFLSAQLTAAEEKSAREREVHAHAQEHMDMQLTHCRERLVARTEQLLRIDVNGDCGGVAAARGDGDGGADDSGGDCGSGERARLLQTRLAEAAAVISEELRREREAHQCAVCLRKERETVLLPCRHNVMCISCTEHVERTSGRCPLCRANIERSLRVFK